MVVAQALVVTRRGPSYIPCSWRSRGRSTGLGPFSQSFPEGCLMVHRFKLALK